MTLCLITIIIIIALDLPMISILSLRETFCFMHLLFIFFLIHALSGIVIILLGYKSVTIKFIVTIPLLDILLLLITLTC